MHRGSSKGTGRPRPVPESLPLSASPSPPGLRVEVVVARGAHQGTPSVHWVRSGTPVRALLRELGHAAEGSAVLIEGVSVPLDTLIESPTRLVVVPTFSGG
jgi:sulfur carrier protein ThiS